MRRLRDLLRSNLLHVLPPNKERASPEVMERPEIDFGSSEEARPKETSHRQRQAALYAKLECPPGSDLSTVRKSYFQLMRRYHPDRYENDPKRRQVATEVASGLSAAYEELARELRPVRGKSESERSR